MRTELARNPSIVFNLYPYYLGGWYLPGAFIVDRDKNGKFTHILQIATPETIGSYGIDLTPDLKRLFSIIDQLSVKGLEDKYNPPKHKPQPLEELIKTTGAKRVIEKFVHRQMDVFLTKMVEQRFPLSFRAEKKALVDDVLVRFPEDELKPWLFFQKAPQGIRYQLQFINNEGRWRIRKHDVVPLTNNPGWLLVDDAIYKLPELNGYRVKPFLTKDDIIIPGRTAREYFEKFILKTVEKTAIEADGFQVTTTRKLEGCELSLKRHAFREAWYLNLRFLYPGTAFAFNDPREQHTTLDFEDETDIRMRQVRRSETGETGYVNRLKERGLEIAEGNYWRLPGGVGEGEYNSKNSSPLFEAIEWLTSRKAELEANGFSISMPDFEDKTLTLEPGSWSLDIKQQNDWFDLRIIIKVGSFEFPFSKFVSNIRDNDRLFLLPDGAWFLIPAEWMTRFHGLAHLGKVHGDDLRLSKSQRPLLEGLNLTGGTALPEKEAVHFTASRLLKAELRPYQEEGARWLAQHYHDYLGACLADDMGLGKTLQTLAVLLYAKEQLAIQPSRSQLDLFGEPPASGDFMPLKALIILPASLVFNWEQEVKKFAPQITVCKHTGQGRSRDPRIIQRFDLVLTTYQTASRDLDLLRHIEWEYIVLDESQYIKNPQSGVFKSLGQLPAKHKVSLSGTPIENSLSDLWAQMQFLNPGMLGTFPFFKKHFIQPIEKREDEVKKEELQSLVQPYLKRRTKEEVAPDLPSLTETVFYAEMSDAQRKLYEKEKSAVRNQILKIGDPDMPSNRITVLAALMRLRQLACHPALVFPDEKAPSGKFEDVLEYWDKVRRSNHKALIFSSFEKHLQLFKTHFEKEKQAFAWLTGGVAPAQRKKEIGRFSNDPSVQAFLITTKAGGVGLNLTAADYVFVLDPWWNPFVESQAIARAHRIGQTEKVVAVRFIARDTIEEKILLLQDKKSRLADDFLSAPEKVAHSREGLAFLLE